MLPDSTAYLRVKMADGVCNFSYSLDGKKFKNIGKPFTAREEMDWCENRNILHSSQGCQ